ncbi:PhzF family phenazine biosynthesis protein [Haliangium sp.]|uniref:PhzF family phenazine biosynthesis protein n=1 Tax=Haliangium sp. TaxID=2663208 RepID=UPI003D13ECE2
MPSLPFMQIDAFADAPLAGNPCAVVFDADELTAELMQAIALENNLSETSFVMRSEQGDARARYFTPAEEIPFAGHPTVATVFALVATGRIPLTGAKTVVRLELPVGIIPVTVEAEGDRITNVVMEQRPPSFMASFPREQVAPLFRLRPEQIRADAPVQIVSTGVPQLMVPLVDHDALRSIGLDLAPYRAFRDQSGFFNPHFFCLGGFTPAGQTSARVIGFPPDTLEDPFTGSSTGAMAAYLWHHGLIDEPRFVAEQGHWMNRPGHAQVEVVGPRDAIETVRVGGAAAAVIRGELMI